VCIVSQLHYTDFQGTTIPYIMVKGKMLFPAAEVLLAVGYSKTAIATHLSQLLAGEKMRVRRNCGWLDQDVQEALFPHRSGLRVFLTLDGVRVSLRKLELGRGLAMLKHINEVVVPAHEPKYLTPKAA
jgi:hypothetical protein